MNAPPATTDDDKESLTHLLGPARRREVWRIVKRLLVAWVLAGVPLYLVAVRVDGLKDLGGLVVLTALLVGVPTYLVVVAGPTAWRERTIAAGLHKAGAGMGLDHIRAQGEALDVLAPAGGMDILPDHTARDVRAGLVGTLHGVPARVVDMTLARTGGTGRRVVFKGLVIRLDLPRATGTTATVLPKPGFVRRVTRQIGARVRGRQPKSVVRGDIHTVLSDDAGQAAAWITPAVLAALADLGRAEGRRLDTTTFASIIAGLLTWDMPAKAVSAGLRDDAFYVALDRRAPLIPGPHPITAPRTPAALVRQWERRMAAALEPLGALLRTNLFRA